MDGKYSLKNCICTEHAQIFFLVIIILTCLCHCIGYSMQFRDNVKYMGGFAQVIWKCAILHTGLEHLKISDTKGCVDYYHAWLQDRLYRKVCYTCWNSVQWYTRPSWHTSCSHSRIRFTVLELLLMSENSNPSDGHRYAVCHVVCSRTAALRLEHTADSPGGLAR
jgi:hypothetical protein